MKEVSSSYLHDYRAAAEKVVVGNDGLNSKSVGTTCILLSQKITVL